MARILVVDDEIEVGAAVRRVLERAGYAVTLANNATEGLEAVAQQPPDVVITDIIMPKVHGVELIKTLRERYPRIRIIAISGGGSFGPLHYKPEAISTIAVVAGITSLTRVMALLVRAKIFTPQKLIRK